MIINIRKTDRRNLGHHKFRYHVLISASITDPYGDADEKFFEIRSWCWQTWGPSRGVHENRHHYSFNQFMGDDNKHWSWINDRYRSRILLAGQEEVLVFSLRWQ